MVTRRDIFQAIADPTRRAILALLVLHPMTPSALAEHFEISRQAVSNHIQILADCEAVKLLPRGREIQYVINVEKMKEVDQWLDGFRKLWESKYDQLDDLLKNM